MGVQHKTSEKKWELLLKTIGAEDNDLNVISVTDEKIIIKTNHVHVKNFRKLLESKETLQKNTLHALFCNSQKSYIYNKHPVNIKDHLWFKRVVSDEFIRENQLFEVFDAMQSSLPFDEELLTITLKFTLPNISQYLMFRYNLVKLQSAITDEKLLVDILAGKAPLIQTHNEEFPKPFANIASKIISFEQNLTILFVINNGVFAQAEQANIIDGEPPIIASDLNGLFIIDKQYLLNYLTPLFNGLVLSESEKIPIVFSAKESEEESLSKNNTYDITMVIDTSGSMHPDFNVYKKNIKDVLDKLENIHNWQIEVVRFSFDSVEKYFSVKNGNTINDIKNYVDTFEADGGTRLYCTVQESLEKIRIKLESTIDLYSTLMIFTDGDNTEGCTENDVYNAASYLKALPAFNMYAIGFGETDTGYQSFFKNLTETGGFTHIKLDNPEGITELHQYINTLTQKINVWEILQGELNLSVSRIPEGDIFFLPRAESNSTFVKNKNEIIKLGKRS